MNTKSVKLTKFSETKPQCQGTANVNILDHDLHIQVIQSNVYIKTKGDVIFFL